LITQTTLFHHFNNCRPYCTPCYQTVVVSRFESYRFRSPHCKCAPVYARPNILHRLFHRSKFFKSKQGSIPKVKRAVCRDCNLLGTEELLEIREKRTKLELMRGLKNNGKQWMKCKWCKNDLGTGPRWWVCSTALCRRECRSVVHQGWGRSEKSHTVIGDEAV
jgi:hypothetical protein